MYTTKQQKPQQSRIHTNLHRKETKQLNQQRSFTNVYPNVVQRELMKYKDLEDGDLKFENQMIVFTKYNGDELFSSQFSGCIMVAFKFTNWSSEEWGNILDLNGHSIDPESSYIAHVFAMGTEAEGDTKYKFAQLENKGLIHIEAMYKPYKDNQDGDDVVNHYKREIASAGITAINNPFGLTGSLFKSNYNRGWIGNTYYQDINGQVKHIKNYFDNDMIQKETYYLKGFLGITLQENEYSDLKSAKTKLEDYLEGIKQYKNTHKDIQLPAYIIQDLN